MSTSRALRLAMAAVRVWTRLYTWRTSPQARNRRLEEIESDLWESARDDDADRRRLPADVVLRFVLGIPDDLAWRLDQWNDSNRSRRFRLALTLAGVAAVGIWIMVASGQSVLPSLPDAPPFSPWARSDPPPPPPPPPCAPPGLERGPQGECAR
jgi:hypothetical protein